MKILVTGSDGQVGQELQALAKYFVGYDFIFTNRETLDVTDYIAVNDFFSKQQIDYCINCAAYTAVDKAEEEPYDATLVNETAPQDLAVACDSTGARLIHLSTDFVYHNKNFTPYLETDTPAPKGLYAYTKYNGEKFALAACKETMIIRTSWVYSSLGGNNFVKKMLEIAQDQDTIKVVADQIGTPTYARDLANAILLIIKKLESGKIPQKAFQGIYNYSNEGVSSWYDFAQAVFDIKNIDVAVEPILTRDYPFRATRPHFSLLSKDKIKNTFDLSIPYWRDSLRSCLEMMD